MPAPIPGTSPSSPPPPGIVIPPITWGMILTLTGTVAGGFLAVIWVLVSLVYGGIKDDIDETKNSVKVLTASYQEAVTAGIKVHDLIAKSPTLEKTISETHDAVIKMQGGIDMLNQKVDSNQEKTKIQLDNIQKQVHSIPGVPK